MCRQLPGQREEHRGVACNKVATSCIEAIQAWGGTGRGPSSRHRPDRPSPTPRSLQQPPPDNHTLGLSGGKPNHQARQPLEHFFRLGSSIGGSHAVGAPTASSCGLRGSAGSARRGNPCLTPTARRCLSRSPTPETQNGEGKREAAAKPDAGAGGRGDPGLHQHCRGAVCALRFCFNRPNSW